MKKKNLLKIFLSFVLSATVLFSVACRTSGGSNSTESNSSSSVGSSDITLVEKDDRLKDSNVVLCSNGASEYKVVVSDTASVSENWAANELVTYIERATGAKLAIEKESAIENTSTQEKLISVGRTAMFASTEISVTQEELTTDGYKIIKKDNTVYICGPTDWGTSFGVLEFLRQQIGYEVYTADEIYYEKTDVLKLKDFGTYVDVPAFEGRMMDGIANYDFNTAYRLRTVSVYGSGEDRYGGNKKSNWIPGPDHTIQMILPESEYKSFYRSELQLCYSDTAVVEAIIENLKELILANPKGYIVNIGQEDGKDFCTCETCKGEIVKYGVSGYFVRFMNKVIGELEEWKKEACPDRYIIYCTFAYGGTLSPPVVEDENGEYKEVDASCVPHEKLYIKIAANACPVHTLDDPDCEYNSRIVKYFYGWSAICPRLMVWDYAAYYQCYLPFYNDIDHIQSSYELYKRLGVVDVFTEMNSGGSITMFGWLRMYLRGKCLWNPDQNVEQLIDNFFENYYKDVAPIMRRVFDLYRSYQRALDARKGLHSMAMSTELWPRNIVDQAAILINEALEYCDNMEDQSIAGKLRLRVEEELVCLQLIQVLFYQDYGYDMSNYDTFISMFEQKTIDMNISKYREHESMADFLKGKKN